MDANRHESKLASAELVYRVVGCAMEVLNKLGHGLHEKPYENALAVEFELNGIRFEQQARYPVHYKSRLVGEFVPDLVVEREVIVDTKVIERISDVERGQIINYLRISGLHVGVLLNFRRAKLEWERVVL